jgi:hypothetical protein
VENTKHKEKEKVNDMYTKVNGAINTSMVEETKELHDALSTIADSIQRTIYYVDVHDIETADIIESNTLLFIRKLYRPIKQLFGERIKIKLFDDLTDCYITNGFEITKDDKPMIRLVVEQI